MADYRYCVGTTARRTTTGTQTVTGIADSKGPFIPKGIVFWSTFCTTEDLTDDGRLTIGFSDGTHHRSTCTFKGTNVTGSRGTRCFYDALGCMCQNTDQPTTIACGATVGNFLSGSFDLAWTINPAIDTSAWTFSYLVLGGEDITCVVGSQVNPVGTGVQTVTVSGIGQITGVLFQHVLSTGTISTGVAGVAQDPLPVLGAMGGSGQHASCGSTGNFLSTSLTNRDQRDLALIRLGSGGSGSTALEAAAAKSALGVGSFALDWSVVPIFDPYGDGGLHYLAIAGPSVVVGTTLQATSAGNVSIALSNDPGAILVASDNFTASASIQTNLRMSLGAADDEGHQAVAWIGDLSGQTTSAATRQTRTDRAIVAATPAAAAASATTQALASVTLGSFQATAAWSLADSSARESWYVSFEGIAAPPTIGDVTTTPIRWLRQSPHVNNEKKRVIINRFELDAQVGTGTTNAPGTDPKAFVQWSFDGGRTWGNPQEVSFGAVGDYTRRMQVYRQGSGRDPVCRVFGSDPAFVALIDAYLDVEACDN